MKKIINFASFMTLFLSSQMNSIKFAEAGSAYVDCGGIPFPKGIITITNIITLILQIAVPLIIIIMGSIDILKATAAKDQKEIQKNQKMFLRRLIIATITFLIVALVQVTITIVSGTSNLAKCAECITQGIGKCNGEVESPNNPSYPPDSEYKFNSSNSFIQHPLRPGAYGNDGSNSPGGQPSTNPGNAASGDVLQFGTGKNPNETAAKIGTTITPEPTGKTVSAAFSAYYPENSALQGGFNDCKGYPLQPTKQTVAAPKEVPYASIVYIKTMDGNEYQDFIGRPYVVTDRGGAINIQGSTYRIDILFPDRTSAYAFGRRTGKIIIVER